MRITEVTRADVLDHLLSRPDPFHGDIDLISFLARVWPLDDMPSNDPRFSNAAQDIWQHAVHWPEDLPLRNLLTERLDIMSATDEVFLKFLVECLHPMTIRRASDRDSLASEFNKLLSADGFKLIIASHLSGRPVYEAVDINAGNCHGHVAGRVFTYEVALSFAGEDREYVEKVADGLRQAGISVFYDHYEEATLWGKDLAEHLHKVYRSARYCVVFISANYANKVWTTHERRSALSRAIEVKDEYILPVRFDDTVLDGIRPTIGYVRADIRTPQQIAQLLISKLRHSPRSPDP